MSLFDPSFYTNHDRITEIIMKLETMRDDLEELNRSDLLEEVDPFLVHRLRLEAINLLDELQLMEENIAGVEYNKASGDDIK
jgi:hypothetical protein